MRILRKLLMFFGLLFVAAGATSSLVAELIGLVAFSGLQSLLISCLGVVFFWLSLERVLPGGYKFFLIFILLSSLLGFFYLPLGVAPNFLINGTTYTLPLVVEESSVVAAASKRRLERGVTKCLMSWHTWARRKVIVRQSAARVIARTSSISALHPSKHSVDKRCSHRIAICRTRRIVQVR